MFVSIGCVNIQLLTSSAGYTMVRQPFFPLISIWCQNRSLCNSRVNQVVEFIAVNIKSAKQFDQLPDISLQYDRAVNGNQWLHETAGKVHPKNLKQHGLENGKL